MVLPDLFLDFQSIRVEETGEKPSKTPAPLSTFPLFLLWFSMEVEKKREREGCYNFSCCGVLFYFLLLVVVLLFWGFDTYKRRRR